MQQGIMFIWGAFPGVELQDTELTEVGLDASVEPVEQLGLGSVAVHRDEGSFSAGCRRSRRALLAGLTLLSSWTHGTKATRRSSESLWTWLSLRALAILSSSGGAEGGADASSSDFRTNRGALGDLVGEDLDPGTRPLGDGFVGGDRVSDVGLVVALGQRQESHAGVG